MDKQFVILLLRAYNLRGATGGRH